MTTKVKVIKSFKEFREAVAELRSMRENDVSKEELANRLLRLKRQGCKFYRVKPKGRAYLQVHKKLGGERRVESLGKIDHKMKKAMWMAGVK